MRTKQNYALLLLLLYNTILHRAKKEQKQLQWSTSIYIHEKEIYGRHTFVLFVSYVVEGEENKLHNYIFHMDYSVRV